MTPSTNTVARVLSAHRYFFLILALINVAASNDNTVYQQSIIHIDATPDADYVLRILKTYRENCDCKWTSGVDNKLIKEMNKTQDKRAKLLDKAIKILEKLK